MKIYVHREGNQELALAEVEHETRVSALAEEHGDGAESLVWIESEEEPLAAELTLLEAGIADRGHVHVGTRHKIAVTVNFNGEREEKDFKPAKTVENVYRWAAGSRAFDLEKRERPLHGLVVCGGDVLAPTDAHIGSLTDSDELCLDLVPKRRFEGRR